jgi:elongator complex protein 4
MPPSSNPFKPILSALQQSLKTTSPTTLHRLLIPTILHPAIWPPDSSKPENHLRFLHDLRVLLATHNRLTALVTLPLDLYPRSSALVRWCEILSDGVIELTPFPHSPAYEEASGESRRGKGKDDQTPQGLVRVHKLPILSQRGEGGAGNGNSLGDDLSFAVTRKRFLIRPFSLPPVEGDREAQEGKVEGQVEENGGGDKGSGGGVKMGKEMEF